MWAKKSWRWRHWWEKLVFGGGACSIHVFVVTRRWNTRALEQRPGVFFFFSDHLVGFVGADRGAFLDIYVGLNWIMLSGNARKPRAVLHFVRGKDGVVRGPASMFS